jgi:hypothetical protein
MDRENRMIQDEMKVINRIQETIEASENVPASDVRVWLRHPSLDVLSVATDMILEHSRKIVPPLELQEICAAALNYYRRCLQEDRESEFVPPLHIAGYELVRWFKSLWGDANVPREYLSDLKTMIADLYRSSDQKKANRLVNAVIEHLFETPEIAEYFADWKSDPVLRKGFDRAIEWVKKSPTKP